METMKTLGLITYSMSRETTVLGAETVAEARLVHAVKPTKADQAELGKCMMKLDRLSGDYSLHREVARFTQYIQTLVSRILICERCWESVVGLL